MKLFKEAGKTTIKMSHKEWSNMGKKAGWIKEASLTPKNHGLYVANLLIDKINKFKELVRSSDDNATNEDVESIINQAFPPAYGINKDLRLLLGVTKDYNSPHWEEPNPPIDLYGNPT